MPPNDYIRKSLIGENIINLGNPFIDSLFATDVDPAVKEGSFAAISRSDAIAAHQIFKLPMTNLSYNAELVKKLSPEMQTTIQKYRIPVRKK